MPPKFKVDDRVKIVNCSHISGLTGTVLGISSRTGPVDFMIVLLDEPLPQGQKAITVIDACLELISRELQQAEAMQVYCTWLEEKNIRYEEALRQCIYYANGTAPLDAVRLMIMKVAALALDSENG